MVRSGAAAVQTPAPKPGRGHEPFTNNKREKAGCKRDLPPAPKKSSSSGKPWPTENRVIHPQLFATSNGLTRRSAPPTCSRRQKTLDRYYPNDRYVR